MVENYKHCITIVNSTNGDIDQSFGRKGSGWVHFNMPYGVAVTQDGNNDIFNANQCNHRIQVLTAEAAFIAAVGSRGSKALQFEYPMCIVVHLNGKLRVCH